MYGILEVVGGVKKMQIAESLVIIDFQNGVCKGKKPVANLDDCIVKINQRIMMYHNMKKPVIFIQHNDEELIKEKWSWQIIDEINHEQNDYYIQKTHANSFYKTNLKELLDKLNVNSIEICGAQTEYCVDATIKMAHGLGYKIQMLHGLSTTLNNEYMNAEKTIAFYENIWNRRFLELV